MYYKKRIGILTYHRSINYGAVMQAYSLQKRLQLEFPDCLVEIIDYSSKSSELIYHPSLANYLKVAFKKKDFRCFFTIMKQAILMVPKRVKRGKSILNNVFENQIKDCLSISHEKLISDNINEFYSKFSDKYDVIIVGSDAVFNWQIRPFPNPYFLDNRFSGHKLSYAASSYGQDYYGLSKEEMIIIKNSWKTFDYLGVRDIPTEKFVKFIDNSLNSYHNCDPTVFLDIESLPVEKNALKNYLIDKGVDFSRPIIGLMGSDWLGEMIRDVVGDDYQIVSVFIDNPFANVFLKDLKPFEWSVVFSFFDITFTHYFHGNLLSLKNSTPTIVIEKRSKYNQIHDSKIRDFMIRIGLLNWCYYVDEVIQDKEKLLEDMKEKIINKKNYTDIIIDGIERESSYSISFLKKMHEIID